MIKAAEKAVLDFYTYPPIGGDDWRYAFQTARVRALETQMLRRAALLEMANAESFESSADLLSSSEYALPHGSKNFAEVEEAERREKPAEIRLDLKKTKRKTR